MSDSESHNTSKKKKRTKPAAAKTSSSAIQRAAESDSEEQAQIAEVSAKAQQTKQQAQARHIDSDDEDGSDNDGEQSTHSEAAAESESERDVDLSESVNIQAMLVQLMKQQKQAKAAAKKERAQDRALIAQLQQQLQQQAISTVRLGTSLSAGVPAPAARSTLKTEPDVLAQQQAAATAAATPASAVEVQQRAAAARAPAAPGVQAAALAAPPRRELPKVKHELEAAGLSKDPSLLKAWVFQMERLLRAMEQSSAQEFTFGDRLSVAQDHWDASMEAWWTSLCDARAVAGLPAVCSWVGLLAALNETYAPVADGLAAARELHQIKQGAAESMEAYVRRVLELQSRIPPGRLPSHVIGDLAINGVDESRFPWTLSIVRGEASGYANTQPSGQGPDMAFIAHRLRTQAVSEPKVMRGAGAGSNSAELTSIKAELAKMQRQLAQSAQITHMAALYTANGTSGTSGGTSGSGAGMHNAYSSDKGSSNSWRGGGRRGRGNGRGRGGNTPTSGNRQPLDEAELTRRYEAGLCFECEQEGHIGRDCPKRATRKQQQQQQHERGAEGAPSSGN